MVDGRGGLRAARTVAAVGLVRRDVAAWMAEQRGDPRMKRFAAHVTVLETMLGRIAAAIEVELRPEALPSDTPGIYERCRALERAVIALRRTFEWYARKYDQRADDSGTADVLFAVDELVRSCWAEPFAALGAKPPTGPLVYLDARFDAWATPRVSVPPDLRAPADTVVADLVREMPIPTIALPLTCVLEPWWVVLAAHETGHHVQKDLDPGLEAATRTSLAAAVPDDGLAQDWRRWSLEAFADAFSVLMVGPAAAWAVDELQYGPPHALVTAPQPGDRYPPPVVRRALLGEVAAAAGFPVEGEDAKTAAAWVGGLGDSDAPAAARLAVQAHLAVVADVAQALLALPVRASSLRQVCSDPQWFAPGERVWSTANQLLTEKPLLADQKTRRAARIAAAAGVRAFLSCTGGADPPASADDLDRLAPNLVSVLAACGEPGTLAGGGPAPSPEVADRLAARCLEAAVAEEEEEEEEG